MNFEKEGDRYGKGKAKEGFSAFPLP